MKKPSAEAFTLAAKLLAVHEEEYDRVIPATLKRHVSEGIPATLFGKCARARLYGSEEREYAIAPIPPAWTVLCSSTLDDAVCGPGGDWEHAADFVPLFAMADGFLVAALQAPHAVGYFTEPEWAADGVVQRAGNPREMYTLTYDRGVLRLYPSLDAFERTLAAAPLGGEEPEHYAAAWSALAEVAEGSDEDE